MRPLLVVIVVSCVVSLNFFVWASLYTNFKREMTDLRISFDQNTKFNETITKNETILRNEPKTANKPQRPPRRVFPRKCTDVDVVYTWVNGSDPKQIENMKRYHIPVGHGYKDYGLLKYSFRSIEKYLPDHRHILLITNGQVPTWLNRNADRFRLITHDQIFSNPQKDLPTFSSNAIEASMANISDLAPCILYMNDDMLLFNEIPQNYYYDNDQELIHVHMSKNYHAPMPEKMEQSGWHASMGYANDILSNYYYPNQTVVSHPYVAHHCYFMRTDALKAASEIFHEDFQRTQSHRTRKENDISVPFIQANVALEEGVAVSTEGRNSFIKWTSNRDKNSLSWKSVIEKNPHCLCINDELDETLQSENEIERLNEILENRLPTKSRLEL